MENTENLGHEQRQVRLNKLQALEKKELTLTRIHLNLQPLLLVWLKNMLIWRLIPKPKMWF